MLVVRQCNLNPCKNQLFIFLVKENALGHLASGNKADCYIVSNRKEQRVRRKALGKLWIRKNKRHDLGWVMKDCNTKQMRWKA